MRVGRRSAMRRPAADGCGAFRASRGLLAATLLALPGLAFGPKPVLAQTTAPQQTSAKPAPAHKPAAAQTPQRTPTTQPAHRPAQGQTPHHARRGQVPPPTTPAQRAALPEADEAQKEAAGLVYYGKYVCDQKWEIHVERSHESPGYVDVRYQKDVWVMKPVASNTGAVRLEDMKHQTLLVQIPSKSMLLNTRTGQRLVDSCVGEGHLNAMKAAEIAAANAASEAAQSAAANATGVAAAAPATEAQPAAGASSALAQSAGERKPD